MENHKRWNPGTLMAQAYRDIANEHNATVDALDAALAPAPIRVPFSDAQIERMAKACCDKWNHEGMYDLIGPNIKRVWQDCIRAALAAGGLVPCAVPDYAPEDVALRPERASDEELAKLAQESFGRWDRWMAVIAAVRARVEAPLMAEIRHLRNKLVSAHQKTERQAAELTNLYHLRQGDAGERDTLKARVAELEAARDGLQKRNDIQAGQLKHIDGEISPLMSEVAKLKQELTALRQPVDPDAWKAPLFLDAGAGFRTEFRGHEEDFGIWQFDEDGYRCSIAHSPADAARLALWLAPYAAAHGCGVGLPTVPPMMCIDPAKPGSEETVVRRFWSGPTRAEAEAKWDELYARSRTTYQEDAAALIDWLLSQLPEGEAKTAESAPIAPGSTSRRAGI